MKKVTYYALLCTIIISANACKNSAKDKAQSESPTTENLMSEPIIIVTEEAIYDVPIVATSSRTEQSSETQQNAKSEKNVKTTPAKTNSSKVSHKELQQHLLKADIVPSKTIDTTYFSFFSEPNHVTVTSYEKKGKEVLKIVSDPATPDIVDHIVFTDKDNNVDIYNVGVGLTAKEARELRKDLKHFVKKGKIFLYTDDSNILYELDGVVSDGQTITDDNVDNMYISSIIWKEKDRKNEIKEKIKIK